MSASVKAFDAVLQRWFAAPTQAELLKLMNQPHFVAARRSKPQLSAELEASNARHAPHFIIEAAIKRAMKNFKRAIHAQPSTNQQDTLSA